MYRKELAAEQQREPEKPFVQQFYVVTDLQTNPMKIEKFGNFDDAMSCYQQVPNFHLKALGVEKTPDPLPGSLDIVQCKNGIDTIVEDYKKVPGWDNPYIQNHVVALVAEALKVQDVAVAYEINDGYFYIQTSEDGYDYYLYPPLMEKPMNQKPSLHQMEHYQRFYENGEYVRAVESTTEQNYNMIDGCVNNLPKPRIINGRESVLDKLRIRQMAREKQKSSQEQSADMERNRK